MRREAHPYSYPPAIWTSLMAKTSRTKPVKRQSSLRQAQRELTRNRIREAAKKVFSDYHYTSATIDQIASEADLSRATLYIHYKDKEEILGDIIKDYAPRAKEVLAALPGPKPSFDDVVKWIEQVSAFAENELIQLTIIEDVRHVFPQGMDELAADLTLAMGENNPIFRKAASDKASPELRAKAMLLLQELTYTSRWLCEVKDREMSEAMVRLTARAFTDFLQNPDAWE